MLELIIGLFFLQEIRFQNDSHHFIFPVLKRRSCHLRGSEGVLMGSTRAGESILR
jgi:hypothetical protein